MENNSSQDAMEARLAPGRLEREERQSVQGSFAIKGTRNGLLLTLEPGTTFDDLLHALAERLAESPAFFRGASLTVDTSVRALRVSERKQLENLLAHYQMSVSSRPVAQQVRKDLRTISLSPEEIAPEIAVPQDAEGSQRDPRASENTLFIRRTVRSGQAIHHGSNMVILGDVNPGAEIVAGGDILVWGVLRGMVHAGYPDNENALVCALQLSPVQLRIAHLLSRPPEGFQAQTSPEVAAIRHGQIVVETWLNGRPPRK